jgi:hypothetical protein
LPHQDGKTVSAGGMFAAVQTGEMTDMSQTGNAEIPQIKSRIGAILRATSGNFLEQFDFFLFGFYASAIAKAFFPAQNETPLC